MRQTDEAYARAGMLLAVARDIIVQKAEGTADEDERLAHVIRSAAEVCAEHGIERAQGWADGIRYVAANTTPGMYDTLRTIDDVLAGRRPRLGGTRHG